MPKSIEVKNLVKRYKKAQKNSVDDISFSVDEGSFFAFLGPNGAGKTTTISILTTTLSKTRGKVSIAGYDLDEDQDKIRKEIGIIFQNPTLYLNLSAEENIRIHVGLYGTYPFMPLFRMMSSQYKDSLMELATLLGLQDDLNKPVKSFSGGMKRKLEILRSLMHKPKILFLDEPTTGLDPVSRQAVWKYLQTVRKEGNVTIFLTTHYLDEAEGADQVVILNKGKIVMDDTPEAITDKLTDSKIMLIGSQIHEIENELKKNRYDYSFDGVRFSVDLNEKVTVQDVIKSINSPLSSVKIHQPTLEEAYIKFISE
jgi:ABC-2 type transport system ATP-binding protein